MTEETPVSTTFILPEGLPEGPWTYDTTVMPGHWGVYDASNRTVARVENEHVAIAITSLPDLMKEIERLREQIANVPDGISAETDEIIAAQKAEIERLRNKLLDLGADRQEAAMERDDPIGQMLNETRLEREEREKNWMDRGSYGNK